MNLFKELAVKADKQKSMVRADWKAVIKPKGVLKDTAFVAACALCGSTFIYLIDQGMQSLITLVSLHLWM